MSDTNIYQDIWDADQGQNGNGVKPILAANESTADPIKGYVIVDDPAKVNDSDHKYDKEIQVLSKVVIPEGKKDTYELCRALFDNYIIDPEIEEEDEGGEDAEIDAFINGIFDKEPMKIARKYYDPKLSKNGWKERIKRLLFTNFRPKKGSKDSTSGFEHVFVGEGKIGGNDIGGYHFWYKYYLDDKKLDTDGEKKKDTIDFVEPRYDEEGRMTPEVVTLRFKWSPEDEDKVLFKFTGGFFVGCSPEGLVALMMARSKDTRVDLPGVVINNAEYNLVLARGEESRDDIVTFYPKFLKKLNSTDNIYQKIWRSDQNQNGVTPTILAANASTKDPSKGYVIVNEPDNLNKDTKVFREVVIPDKDGTYRLCEALFNYYKDPNIREVDEDGTENANIDAFINAIFDKDPMMEAWEYYDPNLSEKGWKERIKRLLFTNFGPEKGTSGFEHVFVGEGKSRGDGIGGYHFWYKYYLDDAGGDASYGNPIQVESPYYNFINAQQEEEQLNKEGKETPEIDKPQGGFFVGCSPEGLVALIMARSKEMTGKDLPGVAINNAEYNLVLVRGEERDDIETFYPIFLKKSSNDDGLAPRSPLPLPAGTRTVRIITAFVNPTAEGDEGESVTLVNIGSSDVNLNGWKLLDGIQRNLDLDSDLLAGQAKTFIVDRSRNNSFTLSNNTNDITLVDSSGTVIDKVTYEESDENVQGTPLLF